MVGGRPFHPGRLRCGAALFATAGPLVERRSPTQAAAVAAAERSLALSGNRYQGGVTSYLEVTTAQATALSNERTAVQLAGRHMVDSVLLIKPLGGGFDAATLSSLNYNAPIAHAPAPSSSLSAP